MVAKTKRMARTAGAAIAAAAAFTMIGPAGSAFAINEVPCAPDANFTKVWSHPSGGATSVNCYANGGKMEFGGWWVEKIETGNNRVALYDANGDVQTIEPGTVMTYPNAEPQITDIEIL